MADVDSQRSEAPEGHGVVRVLVIEDKDSDFERLEHSLDLVAVATVVERARTYDEATELLRSRHYCVIFVDLVLDDTQITDHDSWEGLLILEDVASLGLTGEVPVVIVTEYPRPDDTRLAFVRHYAVDYLAKGVRQTKLDAQVAQVFERCGWFGCHTQVVLEPPLRWKDVLDDATRGRYRSLAALVEESVATEELEHLVRTLCGGDALVRVGRLAGGASPTTVLRVERETAEGESVRSAVIKLGEADRIRDEVDGWHALEDFLGGERSTRIERSARGLYLGGVRYSFIGEGRAELVPLSDLYDRLSIDEAVRCVDSLLRSTCALFYSSRNIRETSGLDLVAAYAGALGLSKDALRQGYEFRFGERLADVEQYSAAASSVPLPNAVRRFVDDRILATENSWLCRTHGDLHAGNVFVDAASQETWLIDFGAAGLGHWARDFALLECNIRYGLCSLDLEESFRAEVSLLGVGNLGDPVLLDKRLSNDARKAYESILAARRVAAEAMARFDADTVLRQYLHAVLLTSLKYFQLHRLLKPRGRKHQVMTTAGLIVEKLDRDLVS